MEMSASCEQSALPQPTKSSNIIDLTKNLDLRIGALFCAKKPERRLSMLATSRKRRHLWSGGG
jgi:hypothetical protein